LRACSSHQLASSISITPIHRFPTPRAINTQSTKPEHLLLVYKLTNHEAGTYDFSSLRHQFHELPSISPCFKTSSVTPRILCLTPKNTTLRNNHILSIPLGLGQGIKASGIDDVGDFQWILQMPRQLLHLQFFQWTQPPATSSLTCLHRSM
jgi:hypothetical protein